MNAQLIVATLMALLAIGCIAFLISPYKRYSYWRLWAVCQAFSASVAFLIFLLCGLTQ